ncbi:hypothetical protein NFI96_025616 [Prochilodus magdalenae]|nr:hypothetical protein NFI96_025616 [Prochilodus magdalenae]
MTIDTLHKEGKTQKVIAKRLAVHRALCPSTLIERTYGVLEETPVPLDMAMLLRLRLFILVLTGLALCRGSTDKSTSHPTSTVSSVTSALSTAIPSTQPTSVTTLPGTTSPGTKDKGTSHPTSTVSSVTAVSLPLTSAETITPAAAIPSTQPTSVTTLPGTTSPGTKDKGTSHPTSTVSSVTAVSLPLTSAETITPDRKHLTKPTALCPFDISLIPTLFSCSIPSTTAPFSHHYLAPLSPGTKGPKAPPHPTKQCVPSGTAGPHSHSLLPENITPAASSCEYTIEKRKDEIEVELKINGTSQENYQMLCKDTLNQKIVVNSTLFKIPFKNLKPCHSYTVYVTPSCKPSGNSTFVTEKLRKPVITFANKIPTFFSVTQWPSQCEKELEIMCNGTNVSYGASMDFIHPFTIYNCTAIFSPHVFQIYGDPITVNITCEPDLWRENIKTAMISHNSFEVNCTITVWNGKNGTFNAKFIVGKEVTEKNSSLCHFNFDNLYHSTAYRLEVYAINGNGNKSTLHRIPLATKYNDRAVLGFLGFLIVVTSVALLFVLYKIYLLKKKQSRDEREMDDLLPTNALLPVDPIAADAMVDTYKKKIADEGRLFMEEFQSIPRIFSNYTVKEAKKAENQSKNRYVDILPYDYNRVPLSNGGRHDYINASFIEGYKESNKYIAAQGPKEETVGDFWRMIWEQQSSIIVMVTRCEEGNKNKCAQYWPSVERETEIFEDFVVKIKGEENCPDYIVRRLSLMNRKEKTPEREVTHIQFTSWPDHGVPGDPGLLLKLRRRVNSFKNFFSGPIVIHCSAGVGRTGTYICIDAMIESLEAEGRVDIYGYVAKLRRQRCLMVQVEAQYVLIHTALIEYNQFGETEISLTDFHSELNTLRQNEGNEPSLLEMEYQKLPKFKNWRTSNTASTEENKKKNRCSSVVPYDFNRVLIKLEEDISHGSDAEDEEDYSSDEEDETPTKYINGSYLDGYWCPKGLIAAQGPLSDTVADFLQMLYQHRVKTVVMLTDCTENGQEFCSQYWNDEKKEFGEIVVEVKETETFPAYIKRSLEIQHTKRKESQRTEQYHFLKWAGNELPANPHDLVDMMKSIRQNGGYKNSRENRGSPVVAHCNDGSSRSGIFCALWNILDSADSEKLVDVFQVAKNLRKERQGMITSLEQYQFLYAALEVAFPVQNGEVKKNAASPDTVQVINEETALISATSEDQEGADSSQQAEQQAATEASKATEASEANKASEASEQPEKASSESTTNGPTVTVEV